MVDLRRLVWNYGGMPGQLTGALASRPAPSTDTRFQGRTYWATEGGIYLDAGASWITMGGGAGSAPDASTSTKGISTLSTAPASPTSPIAVGTNDSRMTNSRNPTGTAGGELEGTYPNPTLLNSGVQGSIPLADNAFNGNQTPDVYPVGFSIMRITTAAGGNPAASGANWPRENVPYFVQTEISSPGGGIYHGWQRVYTNTSPSKGYFRQVSGSGPPTWGTWQAAKVQFHEYYFATVPAAGKLSGISIIGNTGDIFETRAYMTTPPGASGTVIQLKRSNAGAAPSNIGSSFTVPTATPPALGNAVQALTFDNSLGVNIGDGLQVQVVSSDATTPGAGLTVLVKQSI